MADKRRDHGEHGTRDRKARLAEELRANLARRKAQARSRRADGKPSGDAEAVEEGDDESN